jgi:succinyl-diaminopimelate desuccinylase
VCYGEKGILEANLYAEDPIGSGILEFKGGIASNMVPDKCICRLSKDVVTEGTKKKLADIVDVTEEETAYLLTAKGVSKHTANPDGGVNAIRIMTGALLDSGILEEADQKKLAFMSQINDDFYGEGLKVAFEDEISGELSSNIHPQENKKMKKEITVFIPLFITP